MYMPMILICPGPLTTHWHENCLWDCHHQNHQNCWPNKTCCRQYYFWLSWDIHSLQSPLRLVEFDHLCLFSSIWVNRFLNGECLASLANSLQGDMVIMPEGQSTFNLQWDIFQSSTYSSWWRFNVVGAVWNFLGFLCKGIKLKVSRWTVPVRVSSQNICDLCSTSKLRNKLQYIDISIIANHCPDNSKQFFKSVGS